MPARFGGIPGGMGLGSLLSQNQLGRALLGNLGAPQQPQQASGNLGSPNPFPTNTQNAQQIDPEMLMLILKLLMSGGGKDVGQQLGQFRGQTPGRQLGVSQGQTPGRLI